MNPETVQIMQQIPIFFFFFFDISRDSRLHASFDAQLLHFWFLDSFHICTEENRLHSFYTPKAIE